MSSLYDLHINNQTQESCFKKFWVKIKIILYQDNVEKVLKDEKRTFIFAFILPCLITMCIVSAYVLVRPKSYVIGKFKGMDESQPLSPLKIGLSKVFFDKYRIQYLYNGPVIGLDEVDTRLNSMFLYDTHYNIYRFANFDLFIQYLPDQALDLKREVEISCEHAGYHSTYTGLKNGDLHMVIEQSECLNESLAICINQTECRGYNVMLSTIHMSYKQIFLKDAYLNMTVLPEDVSCCFGLDDKVVEAARNFAYDLHATSFNSINYLNYESGFYPLSLLFSTIVSFWSFYRKIYFGCFAHKPSETINSKSVPLLEKN